MKNYLLREIKESDLPTRVKWLNTPIVYKNMKIEVPVYLDKTIEWYNYNKNDNARVDLVLEVNGELIAMTGITHIENSIGVGYTFVNPNKLEQGIGTLIHFLKLVYGFKILNLKAYTTTIDFKNLRSRKMVEKLGHKLEYVEENGLIKEGKAIDRCHYKCTKETFNSDYLNYTINNNTISVIKK